MSLVSTEWLFENNDKVKIELFKVAKNGVN